MPDSLSVAASAAASEIIARRDQLLATRTHARAQRQEILMRLRRIERDLADCRAAARFFGLEIEFPSDEDDDTIERVRIIEADEAKTKARESIHHNLAVESGQFHINAPVISTASTPTRSPRPTLREAVLNLLKAAGDRGLKAAPIREWIETSFGVQIHEKSVGMTLYRLQKEGFVRRDGHVWFLAPPKAETGNPGGETPGPINPPT